MESQNVINNSYNARLDRFSDRVVRGEILSGSGDILAMTNVAQDGSESRYYPYGSMFAHTVGYSTRGKTGIESLANFYLLTSHMNPLEQIYNQLRDEKNPGDNVVTTLDLELQKIAYEGMGDRNGAVVVMEPATGRILAMVSRPDYNPNTIKEDYDSIIEDTDNSSLVNRASQGLYPPGSIFKLVTALEYIREYPDSWQDFTYTCPGVLAVDDYSIRCSGGTAHGTVDLKKAVEKSCNGAFATIGLMLNNESFTQLCNTLLFNQKMPFALASGRSRFQLTADADKWEVLQTAFGQGNTQITPLHAAMIVAAIANGGEMKEPYIIERIENANGQKVQSFASEGSHRVMTGDEAALLKDFMVGVVLEGTGKSVKSKDYQAAAKTGSAQFESGKETHAWFVAFAPADDPKLAISIVLEETGAGGTNAGPIAKKIFDTYLSR